jgi:hypothetical protein
MLVAALIAKKGEAIAEAKKGMETDKGIQPKKIWKGTTTKRPLQVTRGHTSFHLISWGASCGT